MHDPATGEWPRLLPILPPAPTTRHAKGNWQKAAPATTKYNTVAENVLPESVDDESKELRGHAKVYYARFCTLTTEDLRIAVSGARDVKDMRYKKFAAKWADWTKELQNELFGCSLERSSTGGPPQDPEKDELWFAPFVAGIVLMHDYQVWLNNLWLGYQRARFPLANETATQATVRETRRQGYKMLFRTSKDAYVALFAQELAKAEAAVHEKKGDTRIERAKERLEWVRTLKTHAEQSMWPETNIMEVGDMPAPELYYKDFTCKQRRTFWRDGHRWSTQVASRWLHILEPEVNLAASLASSKFSKLWTKRWSFACDVAWRCSISVQVETKLKDKHNKGLDTQVFVNWPNSIRPDSKSVYAACRDLTYADGEELKEFGGIEIVLVPSSEAKRGAIASKSTPSRKKFDKDDDDDFKPLMP